MKNCTTGISIITTENECAGNYTSSSCVAIPNNITYLDLAANSNQTQVNAALVTALNYKDEQIQAIENSIVLVDGSETIVTAGDNITITGVGSTTSPYVVNADLSQLDLKAPLLSPTFTGVPTVPTATTATNTTQIASTAFVQSEILNNIPSLQDITDVGNETYDYIIPGGIAFGFNTTAFPVIDPGLSMIRINDHLAFKSSISNGHRFELSSDNLTASRVLQMPDTSGTIAITNNLALTGVPTVPTATAGTNTTQIASTAFVLANTNPNAVLLTGDQTVLGTKTFSNEISVNGFKIGKGSGNVSSNVSIGNNSALYNTTGSYNAFYGNRSGIFNTTGSYNSFIGANSGESNSSGNFNSFVGYQSGSYNTTGLGNVFLGSMAGLYQGLGSGANTTGSYSIFIGNSTRPLADNQTNQIVIGNDAIGAGSNTATFGNTLIIKTVLRGVIAHSTSYTVATLPTGVQGDTAYVTDATSPTYLGALTGSGTVKCPVFFNGAIWVSH